MCRIAVVDVASRQLPAHKVVMTLEACHAAEIIDAAFARHVTPQTMNTDQGSQFTAEEFTKPLLKHVISLSKMAEGRGKTTYLWSGCDVRSNTSARLEGLRYGECSA